MYEYKAKVLNVVDGDTFDLCVDLGFHISVNIRGRVLSIDTPEKFGEEKELGLIVKRYAEKLLLNKEVIINSQKQDDDTTTTDSFGRWLVNIRFPDNRNLYDIYYELGINKWVDNYSEDNVRKLNEKI